jgi:murein DD-endopeptidase MepM/ murein hydrolase activator NlpD
MANALAAVLSTALLYSAGCGGSPVAPAAGESCGGFGDWQTSLYVLPYPPGDRYVVDQGNCSAPGNGHTGVLKFGYDFLMPIGSTITAARAGKVIQLEVSHFDGQVAASGFDNYIVIQHDDGTTGLYGHLTHDGALVALGDSVTAGMAIGRSGNTGNTANKPHLHLSVQSCDPVARGSAACPTLPINFRNTSANPSGPQVGSSYLANPF